MNQILNFNKILMFYNKKIKNYKHYNLFTKKFKMNIMLQNYNMKNKKILFFQNKKNLMIN